MIYGPADFSFIAVKMPRRMTNRGFQKAIVQIWRDATGLPWKDCGVDGTDQHVYQSRVAGKAPQPAYEIMLDGTWKKTTRRTRHDRA